MGFWTTCSHWERSSPYVVLVVQKETKRGCDCVQFCQTSCSTPCSRCYVLIEHGTPTFPFGVAKLDPVPWILQAVGQICSEAYLERCHSERAELSQCSWTPMIATLAPVDVHRRLFAGYCCWFESDELFVWHTHSIQFHVIFNVSMSHQQASTPN